MLSFWGCFCFFGIKLKNFFIICFVSVLNFVSFPFKWCWKFFRGHTLSSFKRCWSYILVTKNKIFCKVTLIEKDDEKNLILEEIASTTKKQKSKINKNTS